MKYIYIIVTALLFVVIIDLSAFYIFMKTNYTTSGNSYRIGNPARFEWAGPQLNNLYIWVGLTPDFDTRKIHIQVKTTGIGVIFYFPAILDAFVFGGFRYKWSDEASWRGYGIRG